MVSESCIICKEILSIHGVRKLHYLLGNSKHTWCQKAALFARKLISVKGVRMLHYLQGNSKHT